MSKLYLIRRSLENYLGPLTLAELIVAHKQLEFGLQDEVASSCSEWCTLDDVATLKKLHPELGRVVKSDLLGGWEISEPPPSKKSSASSQRRSSSSSSSTPQVRSHTSSKWVVYLLSGVLLTFLLLKVSKVKLPFGGDAGGSEPLVAALSEGRTSDFDAAMAPLLPTIVPKASKSKRAYQQWIGVLRGYAFAHDGMLDGFSAALLRGTDAPGAPADCSLASMRQLLQANDSQGYDPRTYKVSEAPDWLKFALWDPAWIARRQPTNGWVVPKNFHAACLMMADKALDDIAAGGSLTTELQDLRARWRGLAQRFGAPASGLPNVNTASPLSFANCIDRALGMAALVNCEMPAALSSDWQTYLSSYRARAVLFLSVRNKTQIAKEQWPALQTGVTDLPNKDALTGFSYQAESLFLRSLMKANGSVQDATKQVQDAYPEISTID